MRAKKWDEREKLAGIGGFELIMKVIQNDEMVSLLSDYIHFPSTLYVRQLSLFHDQFIYLVFCYVFALKGLCLCLYI